MKTKVFTPVYYLANHDLILKIDKKMTIGRNQGDIVVESNEELSNLHCELTPMIMDMFIKDLNSTNGTYVNKQKNFPNTDFKIKAGDLIKIGNDEYVLYDNEKKLRIDFPSEDRRKNARPQNLYSLKNIFNFFSAPVYFKGLYFVAIMGSLISFMVNLQLDSSLPEHLKFLERYFSEGIILSGVKIVFFVWLFSLIHSLLLQLFLNRNPFRKFASLAIYLFCLYLSVDFSHGPMGGVKKYAIYRDKIEKLKMVDKPIVYLKNLTVLKNDFSDSFLYTQKRLNAEEVKVLENDYEKISKKIELEINKIKFGEAGLKK
jgi:hypothetical protein